MASPTATSTQHRLVRFADAVDTALDEVAEIDPMFASTADKKAALIGLRRVQDRLTALGLKVLAAADDVAVESGHRDAGAWLADVTRHDPKPVAGDLELGRALQGRWIRLGAAVSGGSVNLAQARVSPAQRKALRLRDRRCRAEGCTIPAAWTEAHHGEAWAGGGPTDLDNGVSLCSWHHHRAHDRTYRHERRPDGDIRFTRRT